MQLVRSGSANCFHQEKMMQQRFALAFRVGVLALLIAEGVFAQRNAASIFGAVTDPTGAAVAAAAIRVTNQDTGVSVEVTSDQLGNFLVPDLAPGTYSLTASAPGFKQFVQTKLVLNVDQRPQIRIPLQIGDTRESITVQAEAALLESTHANIGGVIETVNAEQLPLNGRQFLPLALLLPGVAPANGGQTVGRNGGPRNTGVNMGGNRPTNNTYLIDGVDSFGFQWKNTSIRPSIASIQEFKVLNSPYDPQYGVVSGVTVNVITKGGTNQLHGELFEFLRNDKLDSRNFFDIRKPAYRHNQYGGAIGGPIRKDRTFFFGAYEGFKSRRGASAGAVVPTPAQLAGNFSTDARVLNDPASNAPFPGNIIPQARFSEVSKRFLKYYPAPNTAVTAPNFINSLPDVLDEYQYVAKLDHSFSNSFKLFGRYTISNADRNTPGTLPAFGFVNKMFVQNAAVGASYIFGPKTFMDVRLGFNREDVFGSSEQVGRVKSSSFGIANLDVPTVVDGVPDIRVQ